MSRPREFEEGAVLDAAVGLFCARGYEEVSVRDLAEEMGITCASLYNAFGDKRSLYRRALKHYRDRQVRERINRLEGSLEPLQAILAYLDEILARARTDLPARGCMLVQCALDVAPHDPQFRRLVGAELRQIEGFFARAAAAGQRDGTISRTHSPTDLARLLLGLVLGLRVLARAGAEHELLESAIRPARALLEAPRPKAAS